MPIKIGSSISNNQTQLLNYAKKSPRDIPYLISDLLRNSGIMAGTEEFHPDWIDLVKDNLDHIQPRLTPKDLKTLDKIMEIANPLDEELIKINPFKKRITFMLGAGASKPSGIPTVKELLPDMLNRARRLDREDVTRLADYCVNRKIDNIEDLLTAAQLAEFCTRNLTVLKLVDYLLFKNTSLEESGMERRNKGVDLTSIAFLQDTLQVLFGLLSSTMLPAEPNNGHKAIANYVLNNPESAIVTTNYDCCMDLALGSEAENFSYLIEFSNINGAKSKKELCPLIKLHGSLNWFYCDTCQEVHLIDIHQTVDNFKNNKSPYPVIGVCKDCGGQRRGLLVPPLAMKFDVAPALNQLLDKAQNVFNKSDIVIVVGFSFADADLYISRMISKWMQASDKAKLIVFDPDYLVVEKLRRQFSVRIPQFDDSRILKATGDCSKILPEFLAGNYYNDSNKRKQKAKSVTKKRKTKKK